MEAESQEEREVRVAQNQALFRAINERMQEVSASFESSFARFEIVCECADATCVERLSMSPHEYAAVRSSPRRFAVLPGHIYPEVEDVVSEPDGYVVVEKRALAGEVAESVAS